jgi:hypothetical protein
VSDDVTRRLEGAARRDAPAPDEAFADALEQRLLAVAASLGPATPPTPEPPRAPRRRVALGWRLMGPGLIAAAAIVAIAIALSRPGPVAPPELAAPVNVAVTLVDGTRLEDPDGLLVPEGAVIVVGAGGSAKVGETVLQPGDVATMEHGGLRVEHQGALGSVTSTPVPRPTAGHTRAPTPGPGRTPAPTAGRTPAPTAAAPSPTPVRTSPPTPTPVGSPAPPTATPTAIPTLAPAIVRPRLRARLLLDGTRIAVTWTATYKARSYVLLVSGAPSGPAPDPVYPGSRVLGTFARPPELPLRFRVPPGIGEIKVRVIALRGDGSVLRRSNIVTITIPSGDATGSSTQPGPTPSGTPSPTPTPGPTPTPTPTPGP